MHVSRYFPFFCLLLSHSPSSSLLFSFFFLFSKKGKGRSAQSSHSLNLMLSKYPPFNLRSLSLCYCLHPHFLASFPFSKLSCFSFHLSSQVLMHPFLFCWLYLPTFRALGLTPFPGMATGLEVCALSRPSRWGNSLLRITSLTKPGRSEWWGGRGVGGLQSPSISAAGGPRWPAVLGEALPVPPIPAGARGTYRLLSW